MEETPKETPSNPPTESNEAPTASSSKPVQSDEKRTYVSVESGLDDVRRRNLFLNGFFSAFVWMCFHFTLVFFFLLQLKSAALVGIFLGLGNLVSFAIDIPIGVLQKYFKPKKLFVLSASLMFVAACIFLYFIYSASAIELDMSWWIISEAMFEDLLSSAWNILLLLLAVVLYGVIKELSDVTTLSYIMNNADPSEYAELLSKNSMFVGVGSLIGLLTSGVILAFNPVLAVTILVIIISIFIAFTVFYFDNDKATLSLSIADIQKLKVIASKKGVESVKEFAVAQVTKADFAQIAKTAKFLFLKPAEEPKAKIDWPDVRKRTESEFRSFVEILFKPPYAHNLLMFTWVVTLFGFWDTFVTSFLIDFLQEMLLRNKDNPVAALMTGYTFIAALALPAYGLQIPFIALARRIGQFMVIFFGVLLSGFSLLFFGYVDLFSSVLLYGMINSVGYAAGMPLAQGAFSEEYNQAYAKSNALTEIDSNASASPLKMVGNLANFIGLFVGWLVLGVAGYAGVFVLLGGCMIVIFGLAIVNKRAWNL